MRNQTNYVRLTGLLILMLAVGFVSAQGQTSPDAVSYSDSMDSTRSRTAARTPNAEPARRLRAARTIYIRPNEHVDAEYLEYKLDKLPDFQQWRLAFIRDSEKADLVLEIHRTALNYIFSVIDPESSVILVKGKVVAINGLVAAEDISRQIVKRMRAARSLPVD